MATWRADAAGGGTTGSGDRTVTIVPAIGDLILVFVTVSVNTNASPTMTDNNGSGTYTLIATALFNTSANIMSVFVRNALMVNTTSTVITAVTGSNTSGELVAVAISGMTRTGTSAIRQSAVQANQAASGTPAPAFAVAALTGNLTLGAVSNLSASPLMAPPASWTERQDVSQASPTIGLEVVTRDSGFTGTTVTWGATSATAFADIIVELDNRDVPTESWMKQDPDMINQASRRSIGTYR